MDEAGGRRTIAVAGATGFVGRALVTELVNAHDVVALARHEPTIAGARGRAVDVGDEESAATALSGCDAAYYLVHSLTDADFRDRDRAIAATFGRAAARAGVERVVYLGGLGEDPSSEHLMSRQEVGAALGEGGVPVVELRAAVVLGAGSISFEMLRYLTERLPFMVCPRWVRTALQPIAQRDVLRYLVDALDVEPGVYEIGGADVTTYREMINTYAEMRGLARRRIVDVPLLTPHLSSYWVDFVTPVDSQVSHSLIASLSTKVVVRDAARTSAAFDVEPMGVREAVRVALDDQAAELEAGVLDRESGLVDGVYTDRVEESLDGVDPLAVDADFDEIGGDFAWYGLRGGWRARIAFGRLVGERWDLRRPRAVEPGEPVDWWVIVRRETRVLVLRGAGWFVGDGWLGFRLGDEQLVEVGVLRPKGLPGFLYWKVLHPIHHWAFKRQARHRLERARSRA